MYRKMTLVPTRAGYMYECFYCKSRLATDEADNHECIARHEGHNASLTRKYPEDNTALLECIDCPVTAIVKYPVEV